MKLILTKGFRKLKEFFYSNCNTCRILDVDLEKKEVIIQLKMKSSVFRLSFAEAIYGSKLVATLTPKEACWLGGHYGRYLRATQGTGDFGRIKPVGVSLGSSRGQYRVMFLGRKREICYLDEPTKKMYTDDALAIVNNEYIISKFDPNHACYIGILAGICLEDAIERKVGSEQLNVLTKKPPTLRIVE